MSLLYAVVFFVSLLLASCSIPLLKRIAVHYSIMDKPIQSHKTHSVPIPYLGGLSIVLPVICLSTLGPILLSLDEETIFRALLLILPSVTLSLVGLIDDVKNLPALPRLVVQMIASILVSSLLIQSGYSASVFSSPSMNFLISVFWIVGVTNAMNFIDNLDGGAAGITFVASLTIFVLAIQGNQYLIATFALTIAGAGLGFLYWNRNPASIYLGDSGALFIGILLSISLLQFEPSSSSRLSSAAIPLFVMAIPIIDTSVVILSRLLRGASVFRGGRDHLSHRLIKYGLTRKKAALTLWAGGLVFSLIAIAINSSLPLSDDALTYFGIVSMVLLVLFSLKQPHL